jgi:hypothetical protein
MAFVPRSIPGCEIWLDGTNVNGNGTNPANDSRFSTWVNLGESSNNFFQGGSNIQPTYDANEKGVVFTRSRVTRMNSLISTNDTAATAALVFKWQPSSIVTGIQIAMGPSVGDGPFFFGFCNSTSNMFMGKYVAASNQRFSSRLATANQRAILINSYQIGVTSGFNIRYNGAATTTTPTTAITSLARGIFRLGASIGGTQQPYDGYMFEVLYYPGQVLSISQREQLEGYLAWKWDLFSELPTEHPFRFYPPGAQLISPLNDLLLLNTRTNSGSLLLPSSFALPNRVITVKDIGGNFSISSLSLYANNQIDTFQGSTSILTLSNNWDFAKVMSDGAGKWLLMDGTIMPSYTFEERLTVFSTLTTTSASSFTTVGASTIQLVDASTGGTSNLYQSNGVLCFGDVPIGGTGGGSSLFLRPQSVFQPTSIPSLNLWLDAADSNTVIGKSNISWLDKASGLLFNTIGGTLNTTYSNNLVNLFLSGYLKNASGSIIAPPTFSFFIVASNSQPSLANASLFYCSPLGAGNVGIFLQWPWNAPPYQHRYLYRLPVGTSGGVNSIIPYVASASLPLTLGSFFRSTVGATFQLGQGINGTLPSTLNDSQSGTMAPCSNIVLGANDNAGVPFSGSYAEILFFSTFLQPQQREQVEGYLAWKWGLVANLPSDHPYKNVLP